jgi:hypothetical protein
MTAILNSEQVDAMDYPQCKAALKLLLKTYDMEKPMSKLSKAECSDVIECVYAYAARTGVELND